MKYFFDSSAIAKRYHQEHGSGWVQTVCKPKAQSVLYLAAIAEVEVAVALRRSKRLDSLHHSWADTQINLFLRDMERQYEIIEVDRPRLHIVRLLAGRHTDVPTLRSLDAVQLACALSARRSDPQVIFVTADARLATIAQREGLTTVDPAHP